MSGGMWFCLLLSSPYLVAVLDIFYLTVVSHLSNFKNLSSSKILNGKKRKQKKHGGYKIIWLCGIL